VARIAWALQNDIRLLLSRGQIGAGDDRREGGLEEGNDLLFLLGEHKFGR
jgi:hypothetical protein